MGLKNTKLSSEEIEELTQSTHFSAKELNRWYKGFIRDCPSGTLNEEEFCQIYRQFLPFGSPTKFASILFRVHDKNNDGTISFRQFINALSVTARGSLEEKLCWIFQLYDYDHDGFITREDMAKVVDALYLMVGNLVQFTDDNTPQQRVDQLFQMMDTDGDGRLSLEEFVQGAQKDSSIAQALALHEDNM